MKNKFKIELTWHNCLTYPPKEYWNKNLYISDGTYVSGVEYDKQYGWFDQSMGDYIPYQELYKYWWADLNQTVINCSEFKEDEINYEGF